MEPQQPVDPVFMEALFRAVGLTNDHTEWITTLRIENIVGNQGHGIDQSLPVSIDENYDERFDRDLTNVTAEDDPVERKRGNFEYNRAYGWKRLALKVQGKFADEIWLGGVLKQEWRQQRRIQWRESRKTSYSGEWAVSYHGTSREAAEKIVKQGLRADRQKRFKYGVGIYSSPDPETAEDYAVEFESGGNQFKVILQCRVDMTNGRTKSYPMKQGQRDTKYYVTKKNKYIRPYGLLYKMIRT